MVMGPLTNDANEFANFELGRLGYDVATKSVTPSTEDADDLLDAVLGEDLNADILEGVIWAVKNRPVDWVYRMESAKSNPAEMAALDRVLELAGMTHVKESPTTLISEELREELKAHFAPYEAE